MQTRKLHWLLLVMVVVLVVGGILACDIGGGEAKPTISVTSPPSGTTVQVGDEVDVQLTASDSKGVARVELAVDGTLYRTDSSPSPEGATSFALVQTWTAADPGSHTLTITAYNVDGVASDPWAISIQVVEEDVAEPTPTTGAPPPTVTPEPPPPDTPEPEATDTPEPPPTDTPLPELPDLELTQLRVQPPNPAYGGPVEISFDIGNMGHAPSGPHQIVVRYGDGPSDVCEWDKPSLNPGSGGTNHCDVDHIYESYTVVATVDPLDLVEESDEDNNRMEFAVNVSAAGLPDLYISEIRLVPPSPQQGSPVMAGVRVHNIGDTDAGPFRVIWRSAGPTVGCEWNVASLDAGDGRWQQCEYTYSGWNPNYTTTAIVDVDGDVDESNEDNNELVLMVNVRPD